MAVLVAVVQLAPVWSGQTVFCSVCTYCGFYVSALYRLPWQNIIIYMLQFIWAYSLTCAFRHL